MTPTSEMLLDAAEKMVQQRGFNAFSFADLSAVVGITKASVHYHFPTKAALGHRMLQRYRQRFEAALGEIAASTDDAGICLTRYAELYERVLRSDLMCLCGILGAEIMTLPEQMRDELKLFLTRNEDWLVRVLACGGSRLEGASQEQRREAAKDIVSMLEGAMLLARATADMSRFQSTKRRVTAEFAR